MWVYFWTLYSLPLNYVSVFVPVSYCFDYCKFVVWFEIKVHGTSSFFLLHQDCFGYSGSFVVPYKFKNYLFSSVKNVMSILIKIALN